jgi:hypothetical protein
MGHTTFLCDIKAQVDNPFNSLNAKDLSLLTLSSPYNKPSDYTTYEILN